MKRFCTVCVILISFCVAGITMPGDNFKGEEKAIKAAALNYLEGWYEGNVERMDKALHKELAKRVFMKHPKTGETVFRSLTKEKMLEYTKMGPGKKIPREKWGISVKVLDIYHSIATVRTECLQYIDYLHLTKESGEWKIVNVLWLSNLEKLKKKGK